MVCRPWILSLDLLSAKALVWVGSWAQERELTTDTHLFFYDRYSRLAQHYREHGELLRAARYQAEADKHWQDGGQGPPYSAAMAMGRPAAFIQTNAVSGSRVDGPDEAA